MSFLLLSSVKKKKEIRFKLYLIWSPSLLHPFSAIIFSNRSIFIYINKAVSGPRSVFKTCSTRKHLRYRAWGFLPHGVSKTSNSPTASTTKYFQRFKILKYLQNRACMSFDLLYLSTTFTGFLLIFTEQIFLNIEYPLVVWANLFLWWPSWSPIIVYPNIVIRHVTKWRQVFFVYIWWMKKSPVNALKSYIIFP